jgi:hypothetical protein
MEAQKLYLPYGARVRRRQLPGEPGNSQIGKVLGGNHHGAQAQRCCYFQRMSSRGQPPTNRPVIEMEYRPLW